MTFSHIRRDPETRRRRRWHKIVPLLSPLRVAAVAALLVLPACAPNSTSKGDAPSPTHSENSTGPDAADGVIVYTREGGFAGVVETWTIHEDGRITTPTGDEETRPAAAAQSLFATFESSGFYALEEEYLPEDPCCDRFTYTLEATDSGREHRVVTMDGVSDAPDVLMSMISETETFLFDS